MTTPTFRHRDVGSKRVRGRENLSFGIWNVRTLRLSGKLEKQTHAVDRYLRNTLRLSDMRWKNFGEMSTDFRHKGFFQWRRGKR
ncbi:MAG: hypothetical protein AB2693_21410 [Candidatus Thiodiazotropha sp.]